MPVSKRYEQVIGHKRGNANGQYEEAFILTASRKYKLKHTIPFAPTGLAKIPRNDNVKCWQGVRKQAFSDTDGECSQSPANDLAVTHDLLNMYLVYSFRAGSNICLFDVDL